MPLTLGHQEGAHHSGACQRIDGRSHLPTWEHQSQVITLSIYFCTLYFCSLLSLPILFNFLRFGRECSEICNHLTENRQKISALIRALGLISEREDPDIVLKLWNIISEASSVDDEVHLLVEKVRQLWLCTNSCRIVAPFPQ